MKGAVAGILVLFALLYVAPLGMRPLTLPDETRYAEVPREMLADGDWVVPHLCGVRYFEKPPMGYWLTAVSMAVLGENRFAVRLPSALATGISALFLALLIRRATGARAPALWAAFIFLTTPFVFALGVVNVLDAPFTACVTGTIVCAFLGLRESGGARKSAWLAAAGVSAGCGFMVKGFLAFALPAVVIGPFLLAERRWRDLLTLPWIPLAAAAVVVLPWAMAVHVREPDYWRYFIMVEHVQRFLSPVRGQHPEPFWFLLPYLVGGPLVWTFLAPALIRRLPGAWAENKSLLILTLSWLLVPFLFFSASSGKLPTYILPCFAPLAALLGISAWRMTAVPADRLYRAGCLVSTVVAAGGLLFLASTPLLPASARIFGPGETAKSVITIAVLAAWFTTSVLALFQNDVRRGLFCAGMAVVPAMLAMHFVLPERSLRGKAPERALSAAAPWISPETVFFADGHTAPAICWQFKTVKVQLFDAGELAYGLSYPDQKQRFVSPDKVATTLADRRRQGDSAVVLKERSGSPLQETLPEPDARSSANGIALLLYKSQGPGAQ